MKTYTNCKTYHTGLYKPHTIEINEHLISIVYYPVEYTENPVLIASAIDKDNNVYSIYSYDHNSWTGYLAFPNNEKAIKGLQQWV